MNMKKLFLLTFAALIAVASYSQNQKISAMTLKGSFDGTEDIPINDGGVNKRIKTSLFLSSAYGGITGLTSGRIPVASGATTLTNYSTLLYDGTSLLTIGSGTSPITPKNLLSLHSSSASSGAVLGGIFYVDQTVATSGSSQGTEGYVKTSNATGSVTLSLGAIGNLEHSGAGTLTTGRAIQGGGILSGNGTIASLSGLYSTYAITGAGTITSYYGAYLDAPTAGSGTITNRYGLYSADANAINYFAGSIRMNSSSQEDALTQLIVRDAGTGQLKYRASTTFQASDTELTALASTTSAANALPYFTGSGTATTTTLTSFARTLLDDADAATARTTLGISSTTLASGTYTPGVSNATNNDVLTSLVTQYQQVGTVVHVAGAFDFDPTAASVDTSFEMALPVASDFTLEYNLSGTCIGYGTSNTAAIPVIIKGEVTNNTAKFSFVPDHTAQRRYFFTFTYRVL
jgi:hypothetical protein